ncbi:MAG: hypothetical protein ABFD50_08240 [Smithella sp.]
MTSEKPKIDRNYYHSDEFKAKLERSAEAAANDTEYQKDLAAWNGGGMIPEQIIQLEADNQRLREALTDIHDQEGSCSCDSQFGKCAWHISHETLYRSKAQPAPTTGLIDVVRAAYKSYKSVSEASEPLGWDTLFTAYGLGEVGAAIKALPPETLKMLKENK